MNYQQLISGTNQVEIFKENYFQLTLGEMVYGVQIPSMPNISFAAPFETKLIWIDGEFKLAVDEAPPGFHPLPENAGIQWPHRAKTADGTGAAYGRRGAQS